MPLDIEQESEDLLRTALEKLRQRMDNGLYEQDKPYDVLDRILAAGAAGDQSYSATLDLAKREAPALLDEILGREAPILDRLNQARTAGSPARQFSGPTFLDGKLGQLDLDSGVFRPASLPQSAPPPPFPSGSVDPGFFYAGAPEGELAAREAYRESPAGVSALQRFFPPAIEQPVPEPIRGIPVEGMRNTFAVKLPDGRTVLRTQAEERAPSQSKATGAMAEMRRVLGIPEDGDSSQFKSADEVKAAYRAGRITKEEASKVLKSQFGFE